MMTPRGKGDASDALDYHGSSARGRLCSTSPAEGLPPGDVFLRAPLGGAWLPAPLLQPLVCSPWRKGCCRAGAAFRCGDLDFLRPMVSISLILRN